MLPSLTTACASCKAREGHSEGRHGLGDLGEGLVEELLLLEALLALHQYHRGGPLRARRGAQVLLGRHVDVRNFLLFAEGGHVADDVDGRDVPRDDANALLVLF